MKTTKTKPKAAKLTPAQKRVLIAKDVIAQLRANRAEKEKDYARGIELRRDAIHKEPR